MRRKSSETPTHTTQEVSTVTDAGDQQLRRSTQSIAPSAGMARGYTRKKRIFYSYQIIWYVLSLMEIILSFRFVLKLLGANPSSGFATF
ncbi:MAG: hypothetical protein HY092_02535, partial [Candidatus Kerfeldbacteria bacterium]|nr:hypothetical protein [Candidatus Kerfeldbacteria bacterium]